MKRKKVPILFGITGIVFVLSVLQLNAQTPVSMFDAGQLRAFGLSLFQEKDYLRAAMELERYRYFSDSRDDTVDFLIGLSHQLRGRNDFAVASFQKLLQYPSGSLYRDARTAVFYNFTKLENWEKIRKLGIENDKDIFFIYLAETQASPDSFDVKLFSHIQDDSLRLQLSALELDRQKLGYQTKSPMFSAFLSSVIPGLGKVYNKRPEDGLFAFGMVNLFGFTALKAYQSGLVVTGVVTSGLALTLYLGTIYGSYVGCQLYNQELETNWSQKIEQMNPVTRDPYWQKWVKE